LIQNLKLVGSTATRSTVEAAGLSCSAGEQLTPDRPFHSPNSVLFRYKKGMTGGLGSLRR
jgi:hypothetical protein